MDKSEKKTFFRIIIIYLSISFLLFFLLAIYYYTEQKVLTEEILISQMNSISKEFRQSNKKAPIGFTITIADLDTNVYPPFIKNQDEYIYTSYGTAKYHDKLIVVKASKNILKNKLYNLQMKILYFMVFLFIVNLIISFILANISIRPIKLANRQFKIFVEDIIHDLNAPISAIGINIDRLKSSYSDTKVSRISRSLQSINNIYLNLESILHYEYQNKEDIIELHKICDDIIFKFKPIFSDAKFIIDIPETNIKINPFIFERVIVNIIENSVKYSKKEALITLGFEKNLFYIKDNGMGMIDSDRLFARSEQSINSNKGYGLGLSIVKRLCEQLNITFFIKSQIDKGTTFYFDLTNHIVN